MLNISKKVKSIIVCGIIATNILGVSCASAAGPWVPPPHHRDGHRWGGNGWGPYHHAYAGHPWGPPPPMYWHHHHHHAYYEDDGNDDAAVAFILGAVVGAVVENNT